MGNTICEYYSNVTAKPVDWLWYPYIPYGKLTVIQGDPGEGKSTFVLNLVSLLTNGQKMPDGYRLPGPGVAIYQCAEDGMADTIKPRLMKAGANCDRVAYGNKRDQRFKQALNSLGPTLFCVYGNHEQRPNTFPSYLDKSWRGGSVWFEEAYPNLLFPKDGEIFTLAGLQHLVIGGAYSVDKFYRLSRGYGWWSDEQPSEEIKAYVEKQIASHKIDVVLSHTCPYKYEPTEVFLPFIDQSTVDASTEHWLDKIEDSLNYKAWFCGHWHVNKRIDKMHFLFHDFESADQFTNDDPEENQT